jgi:hypothetical protein
MTRGVPRATRIKAAELAAQCLQGEGDSPIGAKLLSLCIFFETYINEGADATENAMRLISRRKVGKLKVVTGGRL